jgi:hypothetical protein
VYEAGGHCTKWSKPDSERQTAYDQNLKSLSYQNWERNGGYQKLKCMGGEGSGKVWWMDTKL